MADKGVSASFSARLRRVYLLFREFCKGRYVAKQIGHPGVYQLRPIIQGRLPGMRKAAVFGI
jgi:hypothetical protein